MDGSKGKIKLVAFVQEMNWPVDPHLRWGDAKLHLHREQVVRQLFFSRFRENPLCRSQGR
jgi:hypothetical protein